MFEDILGFDPNAGPGIDWGVAIDPNAPEPSADELRRWEEVGTALNDYVDSGYDGHLDWVPTDAETLWFDWSSDLRSGDEAAWGLVFEVMEAVLGIDDIWSDPVWFDIAFDSIMDGVYGQADWNWDGEWSDCPEDDEYV
jgi:hypothetical protein